MVQKWKQNLTYEVRNVSPPKWNAEGSLISLEASSTLLNMLVYGLKSRKVKYSDPIPDPDCSNSDPEKMLILAMEKIFRLSIT